MDELIKIEKQVVGGKEINAVDARELHAFLESGYKFADWIKDRIKQYGFTEGIDFISYRKSQKTESTYINSIEYAVSTDMAKELSMVEKNDKGKQARRYFIECEKRLPSGVPEETPELTMARGLIAAQEVVERQKKELEEAKPKIELYDTIMVSDRVYTISEAAKLISNNTGNKIGRNRLLRLLKRLGWVMKTSNEAYQKFVENGYLVCELKLVGNKIYKKTVYQSKLTPKGLSKLAPVVNRYLKEGRL